MKILKVIGAALATLAVMLPAAQPAAAAPPRGTTVATTSPGSSDASDEVAESIRLAHDCTVGPTSTSCRTSPVPAASGRIYVNIVKPIIAAPCSFRVVDVNNGVIVRSGTFIYGHYYSSSISGLSSSYRLELYNCVPGSYGAIGDRP